MPCPSCKITSESSQLGLEHWDCRGCRRSYFLRRCSACGLASHVGALQGWHQRWDCVWCRESNTGFTQRGDPAAVTIADLAADVASHGLTFALAEPESQTEPIPVVTASEMPGDGVAVPASRRLARRTAVLALAVAAFAVVAAALAAAAGPGRADPAGTSRAVSVTAGAVRAVDLQGVPGQLTIVGTGAGRVALTGQLHWSGRAPVEATRLDRATRVLHLSYRCAAASPCTENYRLAVPGQTAMVLRQPSGRVVLSGLAGPLRIMAGRVDISATGLRSPALAAAITSGHLSASFDVPPRRVSVALTSAQATLWLPAGVGYAVSSQVTSGYVHIGIPQARSATRTVTTRIDSGELELMPA